MLNDTQSEKLVRLRWYNFHPPWATTGYLKCLLGPSLGQQKLGSTPLRFIRNTLCSQELILSDKLLFLMHSLRNLFFLPK